jgi:hypothetical protein
MQTIEQLNESLLKLYEDVINDKVSLRKAMTAANVANTLLRGIVVQTQMCLPKQPVKELK